MNNPDQLLRRKIALIERSQLQRAEFAALCERFERPLRIVSKGLFLARLFRSYSLVGIPAGIFAAFTIGRKASKYAKWLSTGLALVKIVRSTGLFKRKH